MRDLVRLMLGVAVAATMALPAGRAHAEDPNAAPNPYRAEENWAKLPEGRVWGQAIGVDIDRDGTSVWVFDRCGAKTCEGSNIAPIQKFDASGKLVTSFGAGMINWPHGLFADRDGNVWVTDGRGGRHLCRRRTRREDERAHREVLEGRKIHQGLGQSGQGTRRVRRAPCSRHGFERAAVRR